MTERVVDEEPRAADLAERALLGALLWDPRRARDVSGWLGGEDFARPAHAAIYQTITGLQADGQRVDLRTLPGVLASGRYHDLHVDGRGGSGPLTPFALHSLLSMTPATPRAGDGTFTAPERSEHVRYARIVLDESIRRRLHQLGTRVGQHVAELVDVPSDDAGEHLQAALAAVVAHLDELTERRGAADRSGSAIAAALDPPRPPLRSLRDHPSRPSVSADTADLPDASPDVRPLGAGRRTPARRAPADAGAPLRSAQLREVELRLLGAALLCPPVRDLAAARLRPEDFVTAEVGATWHAIRALQQRGEPVDVVLLAAEVERQGAHQRLGPGLRPAQLLALHERGSDLAEGYRAAELVVRAALTRAAAAAGGQLRELGGAPPRRGGEALAAARTAVRDAAAAMGRLTGAAPSAAAAALTPLPQRSRPPATPAPAGVRSSGHGPGDAPRTALPAVQVSGHRRGRS
ncbi:MAG: DnaB-like helicase N-terminal domain-containing protein [Dehalococcoidia bacterium]